MAGSTWTLRRRGVQEILWIVRGEETRKTLFCYVATYVKDTTYFTNADWLGTERVRTDSSGALAEASPSLPFGYGLNNSGSDVSPLHFAGKQRYSETGNDYFGARYYHSVLHRWISPDWSATVEPVPCASLANPQTLNRYAMVRDNPESLPDPDGHKGVLAGEGGAAQGSCIDATWMVERSEAYVIGQAQAKSAPASVSSHSPRGGVESP